MVESSPIIVATKVSALLIGNSKYQSHDTKQTVTAVNELKSMLKGRWEVNEENIKLAINLPLIHVTSLFKKLHKSALKAADEGAIHLIILAYVGFGET